jgi:HK97 family phage major capsid protein
MQVKLSELVKKYKSFRDAGLDKDDAREATEKAYAKKGYTGSFVLKEGGEQIAFADLEFKELEEEPEVVGEKGFNQAHAKAIADSVTKGMSDSIKLLVPAVAKDEKEEARHGFKNLGEFAVAVKAMAVGKVDKRIQAYAEKAAPSVAQGESSIESGGALIPPGFLQVVKEYADLEGPDLLGMAENIPVGGNNLRIPTNEGTPWGDGVQAYWQAEMNVINQVKTKWGNVDLRLNDLTAIVPVGQDLLDDSQAVSAIVARKLGVATRWKHNEAVVSGSGTGMPLGFLKAPNLVTVAKDSGQAASSLTQKNIFNMYAAQLRKSNAVWLLGPNMISQLLQLATLPGGLLPGMFNAATGLSGSPYMTLLGRPVIECRNMAALGQTGDIAFVNMREYAAISKSINMQTSIHLFFDSNAVAFRAVSRLDGKPWATKPVTDAHDANFKQSDFVTLAARP